MIASPSKMASAQPYSGPKALGFSKYAPQPNQFPFNTSFISTSTLPTGPSTENVIATKEQIAASHTSSQHVSDTAQHGPDVELALAQDDVLKKEVEQNAAQLSGTVSDKLVNTRRLLELIRETCPEVTDETINALWVELENLFSAVSHSQAALTGLLDKQRNNLGLYHASMMNETIRETQDELKIAHKKVNIQHNLIMQHQEVFQNYKAQTEKKLKDVEDLQERVSRLTLEKGNLRTEVDNYMQLLQQERSQIAENVLMTGGLQKELEMLVDSNKQLNSEIAILRKELENVYDKRGTAEPEVTDSFIAELKSTADLLAKETEKTKALDTMITKLKEAEDIALLTADKAKKENAALNIKYNNQTAEHSEAFAKFNEQIKQVEECKIEIDCLQKKNSELEQCLTKLADLEKEVIELQRAKASLLEQIDALATSSEASIARERQTQTTLEDVLNEKQVLEKTVDNLKSEHIKVASKLKDSLEIAQLLGSEKAELKTALDELKATMSVSSGAGGASNPSSNEEICAQREKIRELEQAVAEWTELAKRSYSEYRDLLQLSKEAEHYRKEALDKDDRIKDLDGQLATSRALQLTTQGEVRYWKTMYENLVAKLDS
ncbi:hypothetical protein GMOD_00000564 [Pyrenophora seminiperda CCB06]|uniref:Uncharacterized protein n=1 Tax=Pyrenophora seminiperda CCB06 TaxID=1302712 RepID=A0A3M7M7M3_9PLEO|nr:hypothetical protein GMOD_00000564 [Pyrenophora seminiperda CCB06]